MATALDTTVPAAATPAALQHAVDRALHYAHAALAPNTQRAYRASWMDFEQWCMSHGLLSLPAAPSTVGTFLASRAATLTSSTLSHRLAAVSVMHRLCGHHLDVRSPAIRSVMRGIRREHAHRPRRAAPARTAIVRAMVQTCDLTSARGLRDRAILLLGMASGMRRSEISALDFAHLSFVEEGVRIVIRRSKTDQAAKGDVIGVAASSASLTCPVQAVREWLATSSIEAGPLFRSINRHGTVGGRLSDRAISEVVKACAAAAGFDPVLYSGHSLRSGLATEAAACGVAEHDIARQTRHRSISVLRGYVREGSIFTRNPSAKIGL